MQFYRLQDNPGYGAKEPWNIAINAPGASQMKYLKQLMLSKPYFERVPAGKLLATEQEDEYDYIALTMGNDYVFAYTFNGSDITLKMNLLSGAEYKVSWFDPHNGTITEIGENIGVDRNSGDTTFDPPGEKQPGNDWVLILEKK
jgi:hypothetical protein